MTEDDTFLKLKRLSFEEMFHRLGDFHSTDEYLKASATSAMRQRAASEKFLADRGWGVEEYLLRRHEYYGY